MTSLWSKHAWFRRTASALVIVLTVCIVVLLSIAYAYMPPEDRTHTPAYLQWMQARHLDHYVEAGNFRLHYLHEGSGEAVILLPGGGAWIYDLRDVIAALAPHYAVYAIDEPGDGYMALLLLRERPSEGRARFDLPGFVLAATGLASVLYALSWDWAYSRACSGRAAGRDQSADSIHGCSSGQRGHFSADLALAP